VTGYSGAVYKKFPTYDQALTYSQGNPVPISGSLQRPFAPVISKITPTKVSTSPSPQDHLPTIISYTDGASKCNPGPSGAGVYIQYPDGKETRLSQHLGNSTNNIGELIAVRMALREVANVKSTEPLLIYTDSKYVCGMISGDWKAKKNQDLVTEIKKELAEGREARDISISWVPAHSGIIGNEIADSLASDACTQ